MRVEARQNESKTVSFSNFNFNFQTFRFTGLTAIIEASGLLSEIERRVIPSLWVPGGYLYFSWQRDIVIKCNIHQTGQRIKQLQTFRISNTAKIK